MGGQQSSHARVDDVIKRMEEETTSHIGENKTPRLNCKIRTQIWQNSEPRIKLFDSARISPTSTSTKTTTTGSSSSSSLFSHPNQHQHQQRYSQQGRSRGGRGRGRGRGHLPTLGQDQLTEMMFGAMPLRFRAENTKVHYLPAQKQIVVSRLFQVAIPRSWLYPSTERDEEEDHIHHHNNNIHQSNDSNNNNNNNNEVHDRTRGHGTPPGSKGVAIPSSSSPSSSPTARPRSQSTSVLSHHMSPSLSFNNNNNNNNNKQSSHQHQHHQYQRQRRHSLSKASSPTITDPVREEYRMERHHLNTPAMKCRTVFGIAIILNFPDLTLDTTSTAVDDDTASTISNISLSGGRGTGDGSGRPCESSIQQILFSHFALIEHQLRTVTFAVMQSIRTCMRNMLPTGNPQSSMSDTFSMRLRSDALQRNERVVRAVRDFHRFIKMFSKIPRLNYPVWISRAQETPDSDRLLFHCFSSICKLHAIGQFSATQFIPKAITAVLSYHLSWIHPFVLDDIQNKNCKLLGSQPSTLARQLSSLYGSAYWPWIKQHPQYRHPFKIRTRIVVTGQNQEKIRSLLRILSFFVRSGETAIHEFETSSFNLFDGNTSYGDDSFHNEHDDGGDGEDDDDDDDVDAEDGETKIKKTPIIEITPRNDFQVKNEDDEYTDYTMRIVPNNGRFSVPSDTCTSFASSLFGDVSKDHCGGFVMMGVLNPALHEDVIRDINLHAFEKLIGDDFNPSEVSVVVVNTDNCNVKVLSQSNETSDVNKEINTHNIAAAPLISKLIEELITFHKWKLPLAAQEELIEDRLRELYTKAKAFTRALSIPISPSSVSVPLNASSQDFELLTNIAQVFDKNVVANQPRNN